MISESVIRESVIFLFVEEMKKIIASGRKGEIGLKGRKEGKERKEGREERKEGR